MDDKVKVVKAQLEVAEELLKAFETLETKLRGELEPSQIAIQELEAWIENKKKMITKKRAYATKLEVRLSDTKSRVFTTESKLQAIEAKLLATEERVNSAGTQAIKE